jgi:hypothetical protein
MAGDWNPGGYSAQWLSSVRWVFTRAKSGKMPDLTGWKPVPPKFNTPQPDPNPFIQQSNFPHGQFFNQRRRAVARRGND